MRLRPAVLAAAVLILLAGCSGGQEDNAPTNVAKSVEPAAAESSSVFTTEEPTPVRKEFVIVREIVRQHELQQGKELRMAAVEKALMERFPALPDKGRTEEERSIFRQAEALLSEIGKK